jgi:hypothetical protein
VARDVNGDGVPELIVRYLQGGRLQSRIFSSLTGRQIS